MRTYISGSLFKDSNNNFYILLQVSFKKHLLFTFGEFKKASSIINAKYGEVTDSDINQASYHKDTFKYISRLPKLRRKSSFYANKSIKPNHIVHGNLISVEVDRTTYHCFVIEFDGFINAFDLVDWMRMFSHRKELPKQYSYRLLLDNFSPKLDK